MNKKYCRFGSDKFIIKDDKSLTLEMDAIDIAEVYNTSYSESPYEIWKPGCNVDSLDTIQTMINYKPNWVKYIKNIWNCIYIHNNYICIYNALAKSLEKFSLDNNIIKQEVIKMSLVNIHLRYNDKSLNHDEANKEATINTVYEAEDDDGPFVISESDANKITNNAKLNAAHSIVDNNYIIMHTDNIDSGFRLDMTYKLVIQDYTSGDIFDNDTNNYVMRKFNNSDIYNTFIKIAPMFINNFELFYRRIAIDDTMIKTIYNSLYIDSITNEPFHIYHMNIYEYNHGIIIEANNPDKNKPNMMLKITNKYDVIRNII